MFSLTFRSPAALHMFRQNLGFQLEEEKVDDRDLYPFVMKVNEKSNEWGQAEGVWKTIFRAHMQKIQLALYFLNRLPVERPYTVTTSNWLVFFLLDLAEYEHPVLLEYHSPRNHTASNLSELSPLQSEVNHVQAF